MVSLFRDPSFLPTCILAGVGVLFLVLAFTLPVEQILAMIGVSTLVAGLVLARLRRQAGPEGAPLVARMRAEG